MSAIFVFGTLRHLPLLQAVAGEMPAHRAAELADHVALHAVSATGEEMDFPILAARKGGSAQGLLLQPSPEARARLDAYERAFLYDTAPLRVDTADGPVDAEYYVPRPGIWQGGAAWSLEAWAQTRGALTTEAAAEVLALLALHPAEAVRNRYGMLQAHLASRHRAQERSAPTILRRVPAPGDVVPIERRSPYAWFFGVEEQDLRFRRFDGSYSAPVRRAGFVMADAVSVLPYDPVTDRVMLVEQFRFGPHLRGDPNPWSLEPVAGRIDPFETAEQAARREAEEETGLVLDRLIPCGQVYLSPGALSETIETFIAPVDLSAVEARIAGLASEDEDIRAHVLPYAKVIALLKAGELNNATVQVAVHWLSRKRPGLRALARKALG